MFASCIAFTNIMYKFNNQFLHYVRKFGWQLCNIELYQLQK